MSKNSINLFQPVLLPEEPTLTLNKVVSLWVVVLVVMVGLSVFSAYQNDNTTKQLAALKNTEKRNKVFLADLEAQLKAKQSDPILLARLSMLKMVTQNKQALHQQLTDRDSAYVQGFSLAMGELSDLHHKDITLQQVIITNDDLTFSGLARRPESVPAWLAGFQHSKFLSGKSFVNFKLTENEQQTTEFMVSSVAGDKAL